MLAESIMQVLADAPLLASADIQNRLLQLLALRNIDSGCDDQVWCSIASWKHRAGPRDEPVRFVPGDPVALILLGQHIRAHSLKYQLEAIHFLRQEKKIPDVLAANLFERKPRGELRSAVKADNATFLVQPNDERANRIEDRRDYIALVLQLGFRTLKIGDVESHTMNKPGLAIRVPHHLGIAVEPDNPAIARDHTICRAQWLAR